MPDATPKKMHWTQSPKGRKILSDRAKGAKHWTKRRAAKADTTHRGEHEGQGKETVVAYAVGYVQAWLDTYAASIGLSGATLAYRVGDVLQRAARRKVVGS